MEEVAGYLRSRYDVAAVFEATGDNRNKVIVMRCCDVALYHMVSSRNQRQGMEIRKERYERAIKWLEDVQKGLIMPDLPTPVGPNGEEDILNPIKFGSEKRIIMAGKTRTRITDGEVPVRISSGGNMSLAKDNKAHKLVVELMQQTEMLTKKDIADWRNAWQAAINVQYPRRLRLYDIYTDVEVDLQVTGAIGQRKNMVKRKAFKLVDIKSGEEKPEITEMFERPWFKDLVNLSLDTVYWGHSLIELGNVIEVEGIPAYEYARLVPRRHVMPEFHVIIKNPLMISLPDMIIASHLCTTGS